MKKERNKKSLQIRSEKEEQIVLLDGTLITCRIKPDHRIVWQALEAANTARERVVLVSEILEALSPSETARLESTYAKKLSLAVSSILELLSSAGLVFVKHGERKRRYFGSRRLLDPEQCELPAETVSRRRIVLEMARQGVEHYKRAIRAEDLINLAESKGGTVPVKRLWIVRDLRNLSETGELQIVQQVRGDGGGRHMYLPAELNAADYLFGNSLTWLDFVGEAFQALWKKQIEAAALFGRLPAPLITADVRDYLEAAAEPHPRLKEPKAVTNALKQLSETASPVIKRFKIRATGAVLWVPAGISVEETMIRGTGTDSNKISAAVEKAAARLGHPVTAQDVSEEIAVNPDLLPAGGQSVARLLSDFSKAKVQGQNSERRSRVTQLVNRVGKAAGKTYYTPAGYDDESASLFIDLLNYADEWKKLITAENLEVIEECLLPSVKYGRILLLRKKANAFRLRFLNLLANSKLNTQVRRQTELFLAETERTESGIEKWLRLNLFTGLPAEVETTVPGWSAAELLAAYRPLYPMTEDVKDTNHMIRLCWRWIRRVPNENFTYRFSSNSNEAAEYLFDRTDALLFAGIKWGGDECRYQALQARHALGMLRDARFVLPETESADDETRITAIACLAFLQNETGNEKLYDVLLNDPMASVRQATLWAYAFAQGGDINEAADTVAKNDADSSVREMSGKISKCTREEVWFL